MNNLVLNSNNKVTIESINSYLPVIEKELKVFGGSNTQTTLTSMSLTMLNGQSPLRMLRQTLAEIEKRLSALNETQVKYEELIQNINSLELKDDKLSKLKLAKDKFNKNVIETKISGALKDIAILIDANKALKEKHGLDNWTEEDVELDENRFHVRRAFELLYRNILETGRPSRSTSEYMQQHGIHVQYAMAEVNNYILTTNKSVDDYISGKTNIVLSSNSIEDFLDTMAEKYLPFVSMSRDRVFGKDLSNTNYMITRRTNNDS